MRLQGGANSIPALVENLVGFSFPGAKSGECFLVHHLDGRNAAIRMGLSQLTVNERIIKTDPCCVFRGVRKVHAGKPCPINRAKAHGAGLARRVKFAFVQLEGAEFRARQADGKHLRVRGRVVGGSNLIRSFPEDLAVSHNHRAKGTTTRLDAFYRKLDRPCHEMILHLFSSPPSFARAPRSFRSAFRPSEHVAEQRGKYMPAQASPAYRSCGFTNQHKLKNDSAKATLLHHSCKIFECRI